jgi:hypothetical protein
MSAKNLLAGFRGYLAGRDDQRPARFTDGFEWEMAERSLAPHDLPVVGTLRAARPLRPSAEVELLGLLSETADVLHWGQTYSNGDFGADFLSGYGWVELFGTRGHFASDLMAGGFLLLGPHIHYPDHHHVAEEIYFPLTSGSLWSKDGGAFALRRAGEIIHHPSGIRHAMQTADTPLVALYLWRGGPLAQKSVISGRQA